MTRSLGNENHPADRRFLEQIEEFGWNVTHVQKKEGEAGPDWSFSCGLYSSFRHPEIVIFGLESERRQIVINNIGLEIKKGRKFAPGVEYFKTFERCGCMLRPVCESRFSDYLGWALWFYEGENFPALQCFWPDKAGHYPWEQGCDSYVREEQPLLFVESSGEIRASL